MATRIKPLSKSVRKVAAKSSAKELTTKEAEKLGPFDRYQAKGLAPMIEEPKYSEDEDKYRKYLLGLMEGDRNTRENSHDEFNSTSYTNRYVNNFKAGNSYTPPRKNADDTSIVTGTTREKKMAIINSVMNLVFDVTFRAFDSDNLEDQQLGEAMSDCVFQANQIEQWDDKKIYAYSELADQGDVFIEDIWIDEKRMDKEKMKISDITEDTFKNFNPKKALKVMYSGPRRRIIPGTQVYLGNIREPMVSLQPRLFTRYVISYSEAKSLYGHLPRWKNVPTRITHSNTISDDSHFGYDWRLESVQDGMVEVICYQNKWEDEYQIFLNGVMQLPIGRDDEGNFVGFPMPWEYGEYNIVQGHLEPISAFFAYSKSIPDKTYLDQQVLDEMYRLAVLKNQKSYMPPIANYSANILTKGMFMAGMVNNDLEKGDIEVMGGNPSMYAMQQSEFEMFKLVKGFVDDKSVNPALEGKAFGSRTTAEEVQSVTKQAKENLNVLIFGFMQLHIKLDWLRLYILLENYTKPTGQKVISVGSEETGELTEKLERKYRSLTVDRQIGGRGLGVKRIEFTNTPDTPEALYDKEEGVTRDETGKPVSVVPPEKPVKIMQIKPEALRAVQHRWYPQIAINERETSQAERISFEDRLVKANQLWGPQAVNQDYAKQEWAQKNKLNPAYFFTQGPPPPAPAQEQIDAIAETNVNKIARSQPSGIKEMTRQGKGA